MENFNNLMLSLFFEAILVQWNAEKNLLIVIVIFIKI